MTDSWPDIYDGYLTDNYVGYFDRIYKMMELNLRREIRNIC